MPREAWIAFQSGSASITLIRPDGTGSHSPTGEVPDGDQTNPDWSPDGERLVFAVTEQDGTDDLWTVGVDGTGAERLVDCETPCRAADDPAWSPDGSSVVFSRVADREGEVLGTLEVVAIETGRTEVLLAAEPGTFYAADGGTTAPPPARCARAPRSPMPPQPRPDPTRFRSYDPDTGTNRAGSGGACPGPGRHPITEARRWTGLRAAGRPGPVRRTR